MSQHDYDIANQTFPATRTDLNNALGAIHTNNSGASAPSTTAAYSWWADTTTGIMKQRNSADSAWISRWPLSADVVQSKSSGFTATISDLGRIFQCDTSSAGFTATLPAANAFPEGGSLTFRKNAGGNANILTIARAGSDTIFWPANHTTGVTSVLLPTIGDTVTLVSDGTSAWIIVFEAVDGPRIDVDRNGTNQTSFPNNAFTKIEWSNEARDTHGAFDSSTNYRFTPTVPGIYKVDSAVNFTDITDRAQCVLAVYKNGSAHSKGGLVNQSSASAASIGVAVSSIVDMNGTSDYVEIFAFQNKGSTATVDGTVTNTWLRATRL